jgi:hypothetical protein
MISTQIDFKEDNLLCFATVSHDSSYILAGGFDKRLHLIEVDTLKRLAEVPLKYYAYCCYRYGSMLYIGGMNFVQVFDMKSRQITQTVTAGKLIYKIIPIDTQYMLCGGSYIMELLRISEGKMVEVCKFETTIYDICRVSTIGLTVDFALATWEGV